ncbi:hemolysin III family protein [Virgibacillus sp. AGTR]|uniref:PAQR family membrane homeostasis protein TrhA n=1 Tax=unclassified Virgibacillus TaxID=2620237 RepID=UPI0019634005|nr:MULTISPECIES: hemolysin III family protein [unclassified Virgibacillus]MCC2248771.1 hemolysin III family protein [Virgibacillus sp. AGTR]MDY7045755.1 hemolysin III family protein [Virgibacillus sp. M23]QRZ17938.1 hemolysin III family protein [Virgibacillus sp. AGTR]
MCIHIREPINGLTHLFGAVLSFAGLLALVIKATATTDSSLAIAAVIVFGISMTLLYAASATYHMVIARDQVIAFLRRIDHSMIYVLIAGTYTPFCLISLQGTLGWALFVIVSTLAVLGVVFKLIWFHSPRWLSTSLYIGMGWIVVFFSSSLAPIINTSGMILLVLGGVFYTIGGIIYGLKPKILSFKHMGFHEIFHIFILIGSLFHFICVYGYVL